MEPFCFLLVSLALLRFLLGSLPLRGRVCVCGASDPPRRHPQI